MCCVCSVCVMCILLFISLLVAAWHNQYTPLVSILYVLINLCLLVFPTFQILTLFCFGFIIESFIIVIIIIIKSIMNYIQFGKALFDASNSLLCDQGTVFTIQFLKKWATLSKLVQGRIGDLAAAD